MVEKERRLHPPRQANDDSLLISASSSGTVSKCVANEVGSYILSPDTTNAVQKEASFAEHLTLFEPRSRGCLL